MVLPTENDINKSLLCRTFVPAEQSGIEKTWLDTAKTVATVLLKIVLFPWGLYEAARWYFQKNDLVEPIKKVEIDGVSIPCQVTVKDGVLSLRPIDNQPVEKEVHVAVGTGDDEEPIEKPIGPADAPESEELSTSEPIQERQALCVRLRRTYQKYKRRAGPYVDKALKGHRLATMGSSMVSFAITANQYVEGLSVERIWEVANTIEQEAPVVFICMQCTFVMVTTYAAYRYLG